MALLSQCQPHSHSCSLSQSWQRPALRHGRLAHEPQKTKGRHGCGCRAGEDDEPPSSSRTTSLESTIRWLSLLLIQLCWHSAASCLLWCKQLHSACCQAEEGAGVEHAEGALRGGAHAEIRERSGTASQTRAQAGILDPGTFIPEPDQRVEPHLGQSCVGN